MTPPRVYKPFLKNVSRSGKIRRGKCESAPGQGEHMPRGRGRAQGIAPTMRRLRMPGRAGWQSPVTGRAHAPGTRASTRHRPYYATASHAGVYMVERNVAFRSPGHFTLCVVCQQSLIKEQI